MNKLKSNKFTILETTKVVSDNLTIGVSEVSFTKLFGIIPIHKTIAYRDNYDADFISNFLDKDHN